MRERASPPHFASTLSLYLLSLSSRRCICASAGKRIFFELDDLIIGGKQVQCGSDASVQMRAEKRRRGAVRSAAHGLEAESKNSTERL